MKLLQHHSVREFLDSEWKAYGLPLYILQLIAYLLLIVPLTILLVPTSQITLCGEQLAMASTTYNYPVMALFISVTTS